MTGNNDFTDWTLNMLKEHLQLHRVMLQVHHDARLLCKDYADMIIFDAESREYIDQWNECVAACEAEMKRKLNIT